MNILHVITRLIIGGAQENTILTCRGLAERGHDVTLLAGPETGPEGSLWGQTQDAGFRSIEVPLLRRAVSPVADARVYWALKRQFGKLRPDVVHTHSSKAGVVARAAARAAGVPTIVHTIHGMSFNRTQSGCVRAMYRMLERRAARYTSKLISVADAMTEQAVTAGIASRDRFVTIRSGMETERYHPDDAARVKVRKTWGVSPDEVVVGTIARLFVNKGYEHLLAAMPAAIAADRRLRLVWVGDGPHRAKYERELTALGIRDRVTFAGLVPPAEIPELLCGFDVLAHASQWEGLPRAVVQALLTEVPVVCFDNDGAPEVVKDGESGILVRLGDAVGLGHGILQLAKDAELRRRIGRAGRQRCVVDYDWRRMVERIDELYHSLRSDVRSGL